MPREGTGYPPEAILILPCGKRSVSPITDARQRQPGELLARSSVKQG